MAGERMSTWVERENNKRRERKRRAIATKIYAGLRLYGNFNLPKHCDNNEVLKALCLQAGWVVHPDGTTFRKGCKPPVERIDKSANSVPVSPCSSYEPSPRKSYDPSPASSSFPSPAHYISTANGIADANSLIPWLKNLSSNSGASSPMLPHLYIPGGSISAPVTPPSSSPTCQSPRIMRNHTDWNDTNAGPPWVTNHNYSQPSSALPSPGRQAFHAPAAWLANVQVRQTIPISPTFSFVSRNAFGLADDSMAGSGSQMWTPGQSGACSPAVPAGLDHTADVPMADGIASEFAFGSCSTMGLVKAWEGERIHDECIPDDLELKL